MTPNEEARKMINDFMKPVDDLHKYPMCFDTAKQCAIITVNNVIAENHSILSMLKIHSDARARLAIHIRLEELQKIKTEIKNL